MFKRARFIVKSSLVVGTALLAVAALAAACAIDDAPSQSASPFPSPIPSPIPTQAPGDTDTVTSQVPSGPEMTIDPSKSYTATFTMEGGDQFVVELYADKAPITVNSFVSLARSGYFDGTTFHRVIPGFMSQGGDPTGTGSGPGPGYNFQNEFHPLARHDKPGILSMANSGVRNGQATNGSQFFITHIATPHLDGLNLDGTPKNCSAPGNSCHSVFGEVTSGLEIVVNLTPGNPVTPIGSGDKIVSVVITEE